MWLGRTYLRNGQTAEASSAWDKALGLGANLLIGACHERTLQPCERGDLSLSAKSVSFLANGSQTVFTATPSDIVPKGVFNNYQMGHVSFGMQVGGKKYNFDFFPLGVTCQVQLFVNCPQQGVAQQLAVANYVIQTLAKLGSGALGPPPTAAKPSSGGGNSSSVPTLGNSACAQAVEAGYSILLQGHLYKVKTSSAGGSNPTYLFFDEKGAQVMDSNLLQQLATAAWTRENVIASPDARNGSSRVAAILGTSKALQNYSNVQDVLARGMVEALEAVVTDGASLSKAVPNLTKGVFFNQLKSAPKTVFVVAAQRGLEASLAAYKQMETVPLPPADATVLNAPDLVRIKALYVQARTLELPYEALASKLMPTTATQLTNQAFASAISELIPSVGLTSTEQVTLNDLLDFQKSVANLSGSLPALQAYSQNLKLALNLADANKRTISEWATKSSSACGTDATTVAEASNERIYPTGDAVVLDTQSGPVRVNNFYRSIKGKLAEMNALVLEKAPSYQILYLQDQKWFEVRLSESARKKDQLDGERVLFRLLGVPEVTFCKLQVYVTSIEDKVTGSRTSTSPSFCPGGQLHFLN